MAVLKNNAIAMMIVAATNVATMIVMTAATAMLADMTMIAVMTAVIVTITRDISTKKRKRRNEKWNIY